MVRLSEHLYYQKGENKEIVVAAPHHGCVPGCDYFTKEIATMIADHLRATLVFAERLKPLVDLNKDPSRASTPHFRQLCLTYQQIALAEEVELFLEIHGHVRGHYDLEISCGFEFDPHHPLDKEFAENFSAFRNNLRREIANRWEEGLPLPPPSIGVFPFDQDVVMKARKTYLFQKIRKLQLQGRKIFGIHIEVFRDYKTGDPTSPVFTCQEVMVKALADSIVRSFWR
ncbi:MAG: Uncharacterized protein XD63_0480 [Thermoanaerobacterales bacterium 50_218]|nr:MAG: Uncharacterized protein XD63_0480 [Thermoanaerobacterales bacterium 50_218]HAA89363.1 hypothetical protein [Peptococcaceae bacterium]